MAFLIKDTGDLGRDQAHKKGEAIEDYVIIDEAWTMSRELRLSLYSCSRQLLCCSLLNS